MLFNNLIVQVYGIFLSISTETQRVSIIETIKKSLPVPLTTYFYFRQISFHVIAINFFSNQNQSGWKNIDSNNRGCYLCYIIDVFK